MLKEIQEWHMLLLGVLVIVFVLLEWRKKKMRRSWRILAIVIAIISLYIMYLKPITLSQKPHQSILLIGQDIAPEVKDSLLNLPDFHAYQYDSETRLLTPLSSKKKPVGFNGLSFTVDTLFIAGYIPPINPHYYTKRIKLIDKSPKYSVSYPKWLKLGEELIIEVSNNSDDTISVNGVVGVDSINTNVLPLNKFVVLKTIPKSAGAVFGNLKLNDEAYYFHLNVQDEQKYIFHLIAESPDFEWRFLKDYLESQGHAVYYESKISKEKYKSSFSNWPDSLAKQKYNKQPLAFDALLIDMEAWNTMAAQRKNNYSEILNDKYGAIIFRANPNASVSLRAINPSLGKRIYSAKESTLTDRVNLFNISGLNTFEHVHNLNLFKNILPRVSVGFLQIQDSYQWSLAGKNEEYRSYWSSVLNQLMRTENSEYLFVTEWPVIFQPFHASFWSAQPLDSVRVVWNATDTLKVPVAQDSIFQERYQFIYYPERVGWHQIVVNNKSAERYFYVHPDSSSSQLLMESSYNYSYYSYLNKVDKKRNNNSSNNKEDSLTFWFFLLFLLSISFLWIEEKI